LIPTNPGPKLHPARAKVKFIYTKAPADFLGLIINPLFLMGI